MAESYYSTQTLLTFLLQRFILLNHYIFVATVFDAAENHPTSNPRLLGEQWCRVASGQWTPHDLEEWERVKSKLDTILLDSFVQGNISLEKLEEGQQLIANATAQLAAPVLFIIPREHDDYTFEKGHQHKGYEDTEEEYLLPDLKPLSEVEVRFLTCTD